MNDLKISQTLNKNCKLLRKEQGRISTIMPPSEASLRSLGQTFLGTTVVSVSFPNAGIKYSSKGDLREK